MKTIFPTSKDRYIILVISKIQKNLGIFKRLTMLILKREN